MIDQIQKHYQRHGDLVLLPSSCIPPDCDEKIIEEICSRLECSRLASSDTISSTDFRIPQVKMLKGNDPWVIHIDNRVRYKFNVTRNMFSRGNIHEKIRVSRMNCKGETIVDMFCGIGYFTLQFLVHTNVELVHAIDWNPEAIECLEQNLIINNIDPSRCVIHFGDNNKVTPENIADRVYLGLIPTSRFSWKTACKALKVSSGGILHLHENVSIKESKTSRRDIGNDILKNGERNSQEDNQGIPQNLPLQENESANESCSRIDSSGISRRDVKRKCFESWEGSVLKVIEDHLKEVHPQTGWIVKSLGYHKVKSFAPGILHMVIDIECRPCL